LRAVAQNSLRGDAGPGGSDARLGWLFAEGRSRRLKKKLAAGRRT